MGEQPGPGPEIVLIAQGGHAIEEVMHEASADGGGGNDAEGEKKQGKAVVLRVVGP
jgi:hypothetical protein